MSYLKDFNKIFNHKKMLNSILFAAIPAVLFYSISILWLWSSGFYLMEIIIDPPQHTGQSSFLGFLSNIGNSLWIASAAICLFSSLTGDFSAKSRQKELLCLLGIFSTMLAVDDFFMVHDRFINQNICYLTYSIFAGVILIRHYKKIIKIDGFAFLLAGSFLALSIIVDILTDMIIDLAPDLIKYSVVQVVEEGFKFIGIALWLYFSFRAASFRSKPSIERHRAA